MTITITHQPPIKADLQHIAFMQPQGRCSEELSDALVADFSKSTAVIDRLHLKSIIAEHKVNVSGLVDSKTAAKIGKLIGAGSLVFIKVHDCKTSQVQEVTNTVDKKGNINRNAVPTTRATLKASLQIVNMTTGVTIGHVIDAKAAVHAGENASKKDKILNSAASVLGRKDEPGAVPYPPDDEAFTKVYAEAVTQAHRALFSWKETKKFVFYNDRECGLGTAFNLIQAADFAAAAREAQSSLETCKTTAANKPAVLARAYYNRGMTLFLLEDYEAALRELREAVRLDDGKTTAVTDAMAECNKTWGASRLNTKPTSAAPKNAGSSGSGTKGAQSAEERLRNLEELKKKKLLTDEEYTRKRREILDGM